MAVAKGIINARHKAAKGVNQGAVLHMTGTINPIAPAISESPINLINLGLRPSTPVCPMVLIFFREVRLCRYQNKGRWQWLQFASSKAEY